MSGPASASISQKPLEIAPLGDPLRAPQEGLFSRAALEALYRHQAGRLLRRFTRRLGGVDADDVVHDAFAKLAAAAAGETGRIERPEAFVSAVSTNVLRDRARAAAREAAFREQIGGGRSGEPADPHRLLESREALRAIERALAAMSPRRRRIFMLHRFEQMSYAEIGREVGMSEKGIKKQIAKSLVELRRAVGPL